MEFNGVKYAIRVEDTLPYRQTIQLHELDDQERATGKIWEEPFDPRRGDWKELVERFQKRFTAGDPPDIYLQASEADRRIISIFREVQAIAKALGECVTIQEGIKDSVDLKTPGGLADLKEQVLNRCSQVESICVRRMEELEKNIRTAIVLESESRKWGNRIKAFVRRKVGK